MPSKNVFVHSTAMEGSSVHAVQGECSQSEGRNVTAMWMASDEYVCTF